MAFLGEVASGPVRRSANVVSRVVADEAIVVPIRRGAADLDSIYTFNEAGTQLWSLIEKGLDPVPEGIIRGRIGRACLGQQGLTSIGGWSLGMNETTYSAFSLGVHQRTGKKRVPTEVSIELTHRCPLECQHCYNNLPMADKTARNSELTLVEYQRLLDEMAEAGTFWVLFTGGEIFARADFLDIYAYAKSKGFLITLFTNGTMLTERIANYLAEYRPFAIEITMYGATRATYEALTQIPGSYDRCIRGIRLLLDRKLPLKLKTVPTAINRHEVYEMQRMAQEDFGVDFKFDTLVNRGATTSTKNWSPANWRYPRATRPSRMFTTAVAGSPPAPSTLTGRSPFACFRTRKAMTGARAASARAGTIFWGGSGAARKPTRPSAIPAGSTPCAARAPRPPNLKRATRSHPSNSCAR